MKNKFDVGSVITSFLKKKDVKVFAETNVVEVLTPKKRSNDLGIGSWGKIDFLTKHAGFTLAIVDSFTTTHSNKFLQKRFS